VRITVLIDETRDQQDTVWGWAYQTLEHHLERGKVTYVPSETALGRDGP
jgi:uncharacterized protein (UPF0548 family)